MLVLEKVSCHVGNVTTLRPGCDELQTNHMEGSGRERDILDQSPALPNPGVKYVSEGVFRGL